MRISVSGSPAVVGLTRRPEALRPYLSAGLPFSVQLRLYQQNDCDQSRVLHNAKYREFALESRQFVENIDWTAESRQRLRSSTNVSSICPIGDVDDVFFRRESPTVSVRKRNAIFRNYV